MIVVGMMLLLAEVKSVPFPSQGLQGEALVAHVEKRIRENGGTPLVDGDVFHFLYKAGDIQPMVEGDFDFWRRGHKQQASTMDHLAGDWYHYGVKAQPRSRIEYVFRLGEETRVDPNNRLAGTTWSGPVSVARMPDTPIHAELDYKEGIERGNLHKFRFKSKVRRNERDVHVYTPAEYESTGTNYPVLYFGDGNLYVGMGEVPQILDNLIAAGTIPPVVAVFVEPVDRWLEYRMSTLHRTMMLEELMPHLYENWRIDPNRQVIIGSSRGGMMALDLALTHPDRFMGCLAFAPAVTETDFPAQLRRFEVDRRPRFSILVGTFDFWNPSSRELVEIMKEKGYGLSFRQEPVGHSIGAWRGFLDELLPPLLR